MHIQSRYLKHSQNDGAHLSDVLLPSVTGGGPFIELPTFKPLGSPSNFLNISLPPSSTLNIRSASLIAVNGILGDIESQFKLLSKSFWYQEIRLRSPASIMLTGSASRVSNYSVIEISKGDLWEIMDAEDLVAWSGYDLESSPQDRGQKKSLKFEGSGYIVVNGHNQLIDIELLKNEELLINPKSLIASNINDLKLVNFPQTGLSQILQSLALPKLTAPEPLAVPIQRFVGGLRSSYRQRKTVMLTNLGIIEQYHYAREKLRSFLNLMKELTKINVEALVIKRSPIFYRISGPGKILINDRCQEPNRKAFSKKEIALIR